MSTRESLILRHCLPSHGSMSPLSAEEVAGLAAALPDWEVGTRLAKAWQFPDFSQALDFVNRIGALADAEDHHPDLFLSWGQVRVELWTHVANGLTENDFILAAKIDELSP